MRSGPWYIKTPGLGLQVHDELDLGSAGANGIPVKRLGNPTMDPWGSNFTDLGTTGTIDHGGMPFEIIEEDTLTCHPRKAPHPDGTTVGGACWVAEDHP